jgi:hypothetical protein
MQVIIKKNVWTFNNYKTKREMKKNKKKKIMVRSRRE